MTKTGWRQVETETRWRRVETETRQRRLRRDGVETETRRRRDGDATKTRGGRVETETRQRRWRRIRDGEDGDETETVLETSRDRVEGDGEGRRSIYKGCQNNNKSITKREEVLYTRLEGSSENYFVSRLALLVMMSIAQSRHTWSRQRFDCIE